jgi:hypothetical protein
VTVLSDCQCKQPWDITTNSNSSVKIRPASFLLFSLSRHLNFWRGITYLEVYFSKKKIFKLKYFIWRRPWKIWTPAMNWSAPRQIRFCACTKMFMNRGDFPSLYQGLLIVRAPSTKKTLGTRLLLYLYTSHLEKMPKLIFPPFPSVKFLQLWTFLNIGC